MSRQKMFHIKAGSRKLIPVSSGPVEMKCLAGVCKISNRNRTLSRLLKTGSTIKLPSSSVYVVDAKTDMLLNIYG